MLRFGEVSLTAAALSRAPVTLDEFVDQKNKVRGLIFGAECHGLARQTLDAVDSVVKATNWSQAAIARAESRYSLRLVSVGQTVAVKTCRTIAVGAAASLLLLIGGCSDADVEAVAPATVSEALTTEAVPEPTTPVRTSEPEAPKPTPEPEVTPEAAPAPPALTFEESMVRSYEVNKEHKGGQANAAIVAESTDLDELMTLGLACIDHYLQEQKAAFCQVWGSEADYEARDPQGAGDLFCWVYYMGVPLNGGEPMIMDAGPVDYTVSACPGGVRPYV